MAWALDLDGVVWVSDAPVAGSPEAVERLRERGERVVFLTNNSSRTVEDNVERLRRIGVPAEGDDLLTSGQAAASLVPHGSSALVCAGPGVEEALRQRDVRIVRSGEADFVVVGWHSDFGVERLAMATRAVLGGARLIGTNDDPTYPTADGIMPGGGAVLAAVAYAAQSEPVVAGKPHQPMASLLEDRVGDVEVVVGDRPSTDGLLARRVGARFALVLSGVTTDPDGAEPPADMVADDLAALVASHQH